MSEIHPIPSVRFDALAGYCRTPRALYDAEEVRWYADKGERLLGAVIRDRTDGDFGGITLARDKRGRFRAIDVTPFRPSLRGGMAQLRLSMKRAAGESDTSFHQGDERGKPVDFFTPLSKQALLAPDFVALSTAEGYAAARRIIEPMMQWHEDLDGNFVQQFQTTAFDARLWELYLFAVFHEMGYALDDSYAVPDFCCRGLWGEFSVEAVTVNPTRDAAGSIVAPPPLTSQSEREAYLREYMPIKFGSALTAKLQKRYWEKPGAKAKPFLLAIADFHSPGSMMMTRSALPLYLYGYEHAWSHDEDGKLRIAPRKVLEHRWGKKVIPSGFFELAGAENVSAVVFSNSGTIAKFNRMGVLAGFGKPGIRLIRRGLAVNLDANASSPQPFAFEVKPSRYFENWGEGLDVFHNPHATLPIHPGLLPGAAHHRLMSDGQMDSLVPNWHPLSSQTFILVPRKGRGRSRAKGTGKPKRRPPVRAR